MRNNLRWPGTQLVLMLITILGADVLLAQSANTFQQDVEFLSRHTSVISLAAPGGSAKLVIAPEWQGRVMTSTTAGDQGASFGWINYDLVRKGIVPARQRSGLEQHIHVFGGEERFWLGPEGGQFSLFFSPTTKEYTFESWQVPALLDTAPFPIHSKTDTSVVFKKSAELTNKAGTRLRFDIQRTVEILDVGAIEALLGKTVAARVGSVGFRSSNSLTNTGSQAWSAETGLPSIWMLGMLKPGDEIVMVIPFKAESTGNKVNTDYFGEVANDRLVIKDNVAYFKGDGKYRAKIGISSARAKSFCGSYNPAQKTLTVLHFNLPENAAELPYVRSQWEHHEQPYAGDVINCYNDGPPEPNAAPLGPFYELESSSPALALSPHESFTHVQTTMHFTGESNDLESIARATLGVGIEEISDAFSDQ